MKVHNCLLALLLACTIAAPAPSPVPTPTIPCDTTAAPAPSPVPTPECVDRPDDWESAAGSTCADYTSRLFCTSDGGYGLGWNISDGSFDDWAVNGMAANFACCGCGGGSTVTSKQACQGHSYDMATCEAVGCCRWNVLLGCRANDKDAQCYSGKPSGAKTASGDSEKKEKIIGGLIAGGVIAGAAEAARIAKRTTTGGPELYATSIKQTTPGMMQTSYGAQGAQTTGAKTTGGKKATSSIKRDSSSLWWLWVLLGLLALCCLLACCAGVAAYCTGDDKDKRKKRKSKREVVRVSEPPPEPVVLPVVEEQRELLPLGSPLLEPTTVETVQTVPTATPTMVETAVPMVQTAVPTAMSAMPAMQMAAPAVSTMPMMGWTAMQGFSGFGAQALPRMGGGGF